MSRIIFDKDQVIEIKKYYNDGVSLSEIARLFGVSGKTIKKVAIGKYKIPLPIADRFMNFVDKKPNSCWIWKGARDKDGYGVFSWYHSQYIRANRASYRIFIGELPVEKPWCLHSCDNPACVNPSHLFAGTHDDNMKDMARKGHSLSGCKNPLSKLTEEQVREIRKRGVIRKSGRPPGKNKNLNSTYILAEEFGISRSNIVRILKQISYKT